MERGALENVLCIWSGRVIEYLLQYHVLQQIKINLRIWVDFDVWRKGGMVPTRRRQDGKWACWWCWCSQNGKGLRREMTAKWLWVLQHDSAGNTECVLSILRALCIEMISSVFGWNNANYNVLYVVYSNDKMRYFFLNWKMKLYLHLCVFSSFGNCGRRWR